MSKYHRPKIAGASIFVTIALADRSSDLLVQEVDGLRDAFVRTNSDRRFQVDAIVILPDHLHLVMTLPEGDSDYATRLRIIKSRFSRQIDKGHIRASHARRKERGIWQRRFWEHHIRGEDDYRAHIEYCWKNPVKHGLVNHPADWPFSSYHRDKKNGHIPNGWI